MKKPVLKAKNAVQVALDEALPDSEQLSEEELKASFQQAAKLAVEENCEGLAEDLQPQSASRRVLWDPMYDVDRTKLTNEQLAKYEAGKLHPKDLLVDIFVDQVFDRDPGVREAALHNRIKNAELEVQALSWYHRRQTAAWVKDLIVLKDRLDIIELNLGIPYMLNKDANTTDAAVAPVAPVAKPGLMDRFNGSRVKTGLIVAAGVVAVAGAAYGAKKVYDGYTAKKADSLPVLENTSQDVQPANAESSGPDAVHY